MDYLKYSNIALKQLPNRVWRTYNGGALLDSWRNEPSPQDGDTPEEWVMSTVVARGDGRPANEGISVIITPDGNIPLTELIKAEPKAFLGKQTAEKYGNTAVLIKMLDSKERLTIQVHPDKTYAREMLNSQFGKTEGWYILGTRPIEGEDSFILFGFKEGVTKEIWAELFKKQDIEGMKNALHKVYVKPGDLFIIHGGVPHAIGSGCFLMEIQEPTDYTMRVEKTTPLGATISDSLIHQGVGEDKMLDCFHYDALSLEETLKKWKPNPTIEAQNDNYTLKSLFSPQHTDCFSLKELELCETAIIHSDGYFTVAVIYSGEGTLTTDGGTIEVHQGDEIFVPANAGNMTWETDLKMCVLLCKPPI